MQRTSSNVKKKTKEKKREKKLWSLGTLEMLLKLLVLVAVFMQNHKALCKDICILDN